MHKIFLSQDLEILRGLSPNYVSKIPKVLLQSLRWNIVRIKFENQNFVWKKLSEPKLMTGSVYTDKFPAVYIIHMMDSKQKTQRIKFTHEMNTTANWKKNLFSVRCALHRPLFKVSSSHWLVSTFLTYLAHFFLLELTHLITNWILSMKLKQFSMFDGYRIA